ncbi:MAG: hypothetical protein H0U90_06765, partial [Actinobacteria bacterium]|nr:hypothetical protein [Actinomycetota bacterium]
MATREPEKTFAIDSEYLSGRRFPYQEDLALVEDVDLEAATPGEDLNWLEDVRLLEEEGMPAVFDRYTNAFLKIYFPIPEGREDELARKVLVKHLQSGNSYGIQLKLGAARVYDDVRMAAKCGPDIIYLDGAEGSTG